MPKPNANLWNKKFEKNEKRDKINKDSLEQLEWKIIILWECEIKNYKDFI